MDIEEIEYIGMTPAKQLEYLYQRWNDSELYYIKRLIDNNKTIPIGELVERIIDVDRYWNGEPWNLLQILTNINIIIPLEDRADDN